MSFSGEGMEMEINVLSEIRQAQNDKYHGFTQMWNLDIKKKTQL
jgi:hypothetical protein